MACSRQSQSFDEPQASNSESFTMPVNPTASVLKSGNVFVEVRRDIVLDYEIILDAAINPDKDILAISIDEDLWLYDAATLVPLWKYEGRVDNEPPGKAVWSPDGEQLLLWRNHHDNWTASIVDGESWHEIQQLAGDTFRAGNPRWSPDGSQIAFASHDGFAHIWDVDRDEELVALAAKVGSGNPLSWSTNGERLAVGGQGLVSVWDTHTWQPIYEFEYDLGGYGYNWIGNMVWAPDGEMLAGIAGSSSHKWLWNVDERTSEELPHLGSISNAVLWSQDGTSLVFGGDGKIQVLDVTSNTLVTELTSAAYRVVEFVWLKDETQLLVVGANRIEIWDMENHQLIRTVNVGEK